MGMECLVSTILNPHPENSDIRPPAGGQCPGRMSSGRPVRQSRMSPPTCLLQSAVRQRRRFPSGAHDHGTTGKCEKICKVSHLVDARNSIPIPFAYCEVDRNSLASVRRWVFRRPSGWHFRTSTKENGDNEAFECTGDLRCSGDSILCRSRTVRVLQRLRSGSGAHQPSRLRIVLWRVRCQLLHIDVRPCDVLRTGSHLLAVCFFVCAGAGLCPVVCSRLPDGLPSGFL